MKAGLTLTGVERFFDENEIIVTKTDLKGRITYANRVFLKIAGYTEREVMGQPHSIVRHPDMPRCVFKLLWDTIQGGQEVFAYVINRAKTGDHYWVYAHVTPSFDKAGQIIAYHSSRRVPDAEIVKTTIVPLYKQLLEIEQSHGNRKQGLHASSGAVAGLLQEQGVEYDEFVAHL